MNFARSLFRLSNWVFVIGVVTQLLLVGLTVVAGQLSWEPHTILGHVIFLPLLIMVIAMFPARVTREVKRTTWILLVVYLIQADVIIFLRNSTSLPIQIISAFHPVLASAIFWLSARLLRETGGGQGFAAK